MSLIFKQFQPFFIRSQRSFSAAHLSNENSQGKEGSKKLRFLFSHFPLSRKMAGVTCTDASSDFFALFWTIRLQVG